MYGPSSDGKAISHRPILLIGASPQGIKYMITANKGSLCVCASRGQAAKRQEVLSLTHARTALSLPLAHVSTLPRTWVHALTLPSLRT